MDLHISSTPEYKQVVFVMLSICLYVCVHMSLAGACVVGWILLVFGIKSIYIIVWRLVNMDILT
jgi:hypothetical protein